MTHKVLYIIIAIICLGFTIYLAVANSATIPVNFFGKAWDVSLAAIIFKEFALGIVAALCVQRLRRREEKSEQKQLEWKAQDAKLAAEIQTDSVKLLEAKIATLETALDKALKRKS